MLLFTPAFIPDAAVATDRKREANPTAWIRYLVFFALFAVESAVLSDFVVVTQPLHRLRGVYSG